MKALDVIGCKVRHLFNGVQSSGPTSHPRTEQHIAYLRKSEHVKIVLTVLPPDWILLDESLQSIELGGLRAFLLQILQCAPATRFTVSAAIPVMDEQLSSCLSPAVEQSAIGSTDPWVAVSGIEQGIDRFVILPSNGKTWINAKP